MVLALCGELRLEIDGVRRERELPGRLGRILLAYLALNRDRAVTRDELIDALWPDEAPDNPGATLSTLLSALRRVLGPDAIRGRGELRLVVPGLRVDVEQTEDLEMLERELLPGFDAPWADERRRELEVHRLAALEVLAREPETAYEASRRLVALAPYRESGYALLMAAQEAQGNVAEALQTFERLRTLLRDELGTVPSAELRAVHARLLAPTPALPPVLERIAARRFVGRAELLALLHERLARRDRRFLLIAGEPGIGKTSLIAAFARGAGATVLYGRSDEDGLTPYGPFAELVAEAMDDAVGNGFERYRLFEGVVARLARLSPLVVACDDLHWADRPTLQLLRHLARAPEPRSLLLVGAYRPAEAGPGLRELIADLRREHVYEEHALGGLDAGEAAALLEGMRPPLVRRLHELSGGNPLFLDELRRAGGIEVTEGIKAVVLRRVARLGEPALEALTLAAVAGETFTSALLGDAALDVIDAALADGLLVPADAPDRLAFAHALIRQTLYESLSPPRRVHIHRLVAERLETLPRRDPAELAHHYFRARHLSGPEPVIRYAREAAARASASLAWEDEAAHLERALEAEPAEIAERIELLLALGEARMKSGLTAGRTAFAEAAKLARGRSPEQLARAAIGYPGRYYEAGVIDAELIEMLREALGGLDDGALRCRVLARLAEALHFAGELDAALRLSEEALAMARALGDDGVLATALTAREITLLFVAHVDERIMLGREVLALADRTHDPGLELQALHARIFDRLTRGELLGARQDLARMESVARVMREPLYLHFAVGWTCVFAQFDGRLEDAERLALESYELRRRLETRDAEAVLAAQLFMIRRAQGRVGELGQAVLDAIERHPALAVWRTAIPLLHLAAGDDARARAALAAIDPDAIPRDFFWLTAMTLLSEASAALAAPERLYEALLPYESRWMQVGYAAGDGPVARSLGLLAAARGETERAREHLARALALSAGAPAFEARARADLSRLGEPAQR
ncbi:ATP-binding protein [Solirubrobacter soli]|uniref:ATP-binding protein n=1 Tax=Solirubrobacter soli TaxID=363832 RepID=UPI0003FB1CC7|nr:AAA family ATPase [Solirubrobacter soli]